MRCYICDVVIDTPQFNSDHEDFEPCETCKQVIADTVGAYDDRAATVQEDVLPAFSSDADDILDNIMIRPKYSV